MRKGLFLSFRYLLIVSVFLCISWSISDARETSFIPKARSVKAVIINDAEDAAILYKNSFQSGRAKFSNDFNEITDIKSDEYAVSGYNVHASIRYSDFLHEFTDIQKSVIFREENRYGVPNVYVKTTSRYFDISGEAAMGTLSGALSAGFYTGLDRYRDMGVIDVAATAKAAALMAGSSYLGLTTGSLINPLVSSSLGAGLGNALGNAAGGAAGGFLYAVSTYAMGSTDRHVARLMMVKSVLGSATSAGITAILGTSVVTTGIFAIGTFAMPFLTSLLAGYLVEKFFELIDTQEEKERIDNLLKKIR